jgi:Fe-Mn family superoxide dismutase
MNAVKISKYQEQRFDHLKRLDGISDGQIAEHLALYGGYVRQVNTLNGELAALRAQGRASGRDTEFAELTRRLGFEYNGMILHEYYFSNLRPAANPAPPIGADIVPALAQSFGSWEQWRTDFHAIGTLRGVGWVLLCQDPVTNRLSNHWVTLHQDGVPAGFKPLLVMDVWEHAFMRDYQATERVKYIDAFLRNVDWTVVDRRLHERGALRPAAAA